MKIDIKLNIAQEVQDFDPDFKVLSNVNQHHGIYIEPENARVLYTHKRSLLGFLVFGLTTIVVTILTLFGKVPLFGVLLTLTGTTYCFLKSRKGIQLMDKIQTDVEQINEKIQEDMESIIENYRAFVFHVDNDEKKVTDVEIQFKVNQIVKGDNPTAVNILDTTINSKVYTLSDPTIVPLLKQLKTTGEKPENSIAYCEVDELDNLENATWHYHVITPEETVELMFYEMEKING